MSQFLIILTAFFQLLRQLVFALCSLTGFTSICAVIDHVLHAVNLALIDTLHAMQIVDAKIADGICVIAMKINQRLETVLLPAVKEPVNRAFARSSHRIGLAVVLEKIGQKISAKIIQKSTIKSKELEEKVKREIRFSKYFRHPNIIHLYEVIETQNEIIMIMEYASGGELFDLICRGQVIKYIYNILLNIVIRK